MEKGWQFQDVMLQIWSIYASERTIFPMQRGWEPRDFAVTKDAIVYPDILLSIDLKKAEQIITAAGKGHYETLTPEIFNTIQNIAIQSHAEVDTIGKRKFLIENSVLLAKVLSAATDVFEVKSDDQVLFWQDTTDLYALNIASPKLSLFPLVFAHTPNYYARFHTIVRIPAENMLNLLTIGRAIRTEYDDFQLDWSYRWDEIRELTSHLPDEMPLVFPNIAGKRLSIHTDKFNSGIANDPPYKLLREKETFSTVGQLNRIKTMALPDSPAVFLADIPNIMTPSIEPYQVLYCRGLSFHPDRLEIVLFDNIPTI